MSESGAFVTGGGGFVRVRDNASGGFAAELRQQQQAETDRLAKFPISWLTRYSEHAETAAANRAWNIGDLDLNHISALQRTKVI